MWFGDLIIFFITLSVIVIGYYKWTYQYWRRRNVQHLEPSIPWGNLGGDGKSRQHVGLRLKRVYDIMKEKGWEYGGIFGVLSPIFLVLDLDLIKNIMTKDFQYFPDRGTYYNEKGDPLSAHLVNLRGVKWRNLRTKLTPTFTSGKMKTMFQTLVDCEVNLYKKIQTECEREAPLDIKEILGCFTTDIIGSCAFGLECNTFEEENSPFRIYGRKIFDRTFTQQVKRAFANNFPNLAHFLNVALVAPDIHNFFMKLVKDTVSYREKNSANRKDFMQTLIDLKNNKLAEEEGYKHDGTTLTMDEIAAQSFVFFIAGFETSSTTMTFALYELARHQDIQDKVRDEIRSVLAKHDGKITYDAIQEMKYMNQVIDEALRLYPPVALLPRRCVKDYRLPGTETVIEKGTMVFISILGIHHDERYYPNPENFDPERFGDENRSTRHGYAHLPFGEGPRACIGMRFGLMQTKVGLTSLLRNFRFTLNGRTKEPLQMKSNSLVLAAKGEIWLNAHKV